MQGRAVQNQGFGFVLQDHCPGAPTSIPAGSAHPAPAPRDQGQWGAANVGCGAMLCHPVPFLWSVRDVWLWCVPEANLAFISVMTPVWAPQKKAIKNMIRPMTSHGAILFNCRGGGEPNLGDGDHSLPSRGVSLHSLVPQWFSLVPQWFSLVPQMTPFWAPAPCPGLRGALRPCGRGTRTRDAVERPPAHPRGGGALNLALCSKPRPNPRRRGRQGIPARQKHGDTTLHWQSAPSRPWGSQPPAGVRRKLVPGGAAQPSGSPACSGAL